MNKTTLATTAALIGFAANSLLCRAALSGSAIDAWSFTCIRLGGGALALFLLARIAAPRAREQSGSTVNADAHARIPIKRAAGSWVSAAALFTYAAAFSLAYVRINTGVGALVLFACVQLTMIGWSIRGGERPTFVEWVGLAVALGGFVLLTSVGVMPGAGAPDPVGVALMMIAGIAWGAYSLRGRASRSPLASTADNFMRSVPMAIGGALVFAIGGFGRDSSAVHFSARGIWLALASGCVASGLGYSLWYRALPGLTATRAAIVQLIVPILAATLGVLLLGEPFDVRRSLPSLMILGGVAAAVFGRRRTTTVPAGSIEPDMDSATPSVETDSR